MYVSNVSILWHLRFCSNCFIYQYLILAHLSEVGTPKPSAVCSLCFPAKSQLSDSMICHLLVLPLAPNTWSAATILSLAEFKSSNGTQRNSSSTAGAALRRRISVPASRWHNHLAAGGVVCSIVGFFAWLSREGNMKSWCGSNLCIPM